MIPTATYLKQPGARGRLGGARRVAQPSAPPRPPFACDSPQRPAGKRDVSTPFAPGASPCLIGSPTPAFSSERSAAHVVGKENQGTGLSTQAQAQPAAASPKKPATPTAGAIEQSCTRPGCDGTGAAAAEAAGALLLELLRPLQRALDVASEGGGAGERALAAAMRALGMPAQLVRQLSPQLGAAAAAGQPLH